MPLSVAAAASARTDTAHARRRGRASQPGGAGVVAACAADVPRAERILIADRLREKRQGEEFISPSKISARKKASAVSKALAYLYLVLCFVVKHRNLLLTIQLLVDVIHPEMEELTVLRINDLAILSNETAKDFFLTNMVKIFHLPEHLLFLEDALDFCFCVVYNNMAYIPCS